MKNDYGQLIEITSALERIATALERSNEIQERTGMLQRLDPATVALDILMSESKPKDTEAPNGADNR
jgi:exonuclease VII small subunit